MTKKKMVLLIEDDPDEVLLFEEVLGQISDRYTFKSAENGVAGIEQITHFVKKGELPSLIVLDINMPLMNGREVALKLKEMNLLGEVPVAVFTTSDSATDKAYFADLSVPYFNKPLTILEYYKKIKEMVELCP